MATSKITVGNFIYRGSEYAGDVNDLTLPGWIHANSNAQNLPEETGFAIITFSFADTVVQFAVRRNGNALYMRRRTYSTWFPWVSVTLGGGNFKVTSQRSTARWAA